MIIWSYARRGEWWTVLGFFAFVAMMAAGYFYNLTFVQLGLVDLGARVVGLGEGGVAMHMALFAVLTALISLAVGWTMMRRGWSAQFVTKLRLAFVSVAGQATLTALVPLVDSEPRFIAWILAACVSLGIGVPSTFGLAVDLVPVRARGSAGALITAGAFFPAAVFTTDWQIEPFARQMLPLLVAGAIGLGVLAWARLGVLERLEVQHRDDAFGRGRFVQRGPAGDRADRRLLAAFLLMFAIYFIDSLGFLRILVTPILIATTWHAPDTETLLVIGGAHMVGAAIAGILYGALDIRQLFLWIFGIFALLHFGYSFHVELVPQSYAGVGTAVLYALAVSMYTVLNFTLWADLSTPRTITMYTALGVALSAWMATFLSTALALRWGAEELPLVEHFNVLTSLALILFVVVLAGYLAQVWQRRAAA